METMRLTKDLARNLKGRMFFVDGDEEHYHPLGEPEILAHGKVVLKFLQGWSWGLPCRAQPYTVRIGDFVHLATKQEEGRLKA